MQVYSYTEKSIAVFGDTKPHAKQLGGFGGSFNYNLKGPTGNTPGWIFPKTREAEIVAFLQAANSGQIQVAAPVQQFVSTLAPIAPLGSLQPVLPAMSPQSSLAQLRQGGLPAPRLNIVQPVSMIPSAAITLSAPTTFLAADGLTYSVVIYTVPIPKIGSKVTVVFKDANHEIATTVVAETVNAFGPASPIIEYTKEDGAQVQHRLDLVNGVWQILGESVAHDIKLV